MNQRQTNEPSIDESVSLLFAVGRDEGKYIAVIRELNPEGNCPALDYLQAQKLVSVQVRKLLYAEENRGKKHPILYAKCGLTSDGLRIYNIIEQIHGDMLDSVEREMWGAVMRRRPADEASLDECVSLLFAIGRDQGRNVAVARELDSKGNCRGLDFLASEKLVYVHLRKLLYAEENGEKKYPILYTKCGLMPKGNGIYTFIDQRYQSMLASVAREIWGLGTK